MSDAAIGLDGATAAQVQLALDESGLGVTGAGIEIGVLSDSFNDLGGAAADEASGALPPASDINVLQDLSSGGTDEGRAMMQVIHDVAPGASLAFYTADDSEQDFANGILALAAAGCKVICDDTQYLDEPFFQNGVVAQAIQTVEAEGVTYITAAGNDASTGYQAAWTPISGSFDRTNLSDAESFGGSLVQTVTVDASVAEPVPLLLEWNQPYGDGTSDLELLVFRNGTLYGTATNQSSGEPTNPWVEFTLTASGTYQVAIENLSGPDPGLIKEILDSDGEAATLSGANVGTVYGHAMTPGAITAAAVNVADTPAFGVNPAVNESFSSSGAGTELLFADDGAALSSPDVLSPVAVSGVDNIKTTVSDIGDFAGTSAAAASLAGVAALILSANPDLSPAQVEEIMEETALPMADSAVSGAGLVQVDPAVAAALALAAAPPAVTAVVDEPSAGIVNAGTAITITLDFSTTVTVTGTPTLTLNDGGTATYSSGSGSGALVFTDTVAASDADVAALAATSVNLNGGTIADGSGDSANLSLSGLTQTGPQIDTDANFVTQLYQTVLLRQPDAGGLSYWTSQLEAESLTRAQVVADFVDAAEAQDFVLPIVRLYQAFLDRAPDPGGLSTWVNLLRSGVPLTVIAGDFAASPEFQRDYPAGTSPTTFVTDLYETVLGRAPDSAGEQYWVNFLNQNNDSLAAQATVALDFANSQEFITDSTGPIDAWLTAAGDTGSYAATIAYPAAASGADQALASASADAAASMLTIAPGDEGLTSVGSAHWPNANFSLDAGAAVTLTASGVPEFTVSIPTAGNQSFDLALQYEPAGSSPGSAIFAGGQSGQVVALDQAGIPATIGTIVASGLASDLVFAPDARADGSDGAPPALTVIGGSGWNTIELATAGDVLDGGTSGHNTLVVAAPSNAAGIGINLSLGAGVNEVTAFGGSATLPYATDFQNVDLSGITGGPAGATIVASPGGSTIIDSQFSDNITLAASGTGDDTIGLSGNAFAPIDLASPAGGTASFTQFTSVANFDAAGTDQVALTSGYAASLTNGIAGAAAVAQVAAGMVDTAAAGGGHDVFFITPAANVVLTSAASVAAAIGAVTTAATDTFVVILDNGASAASSTQFGVYQVTADETAGAALGSNPADAVKLIGLFAAAGGFAEHNYLAPIAA